MKVALRQKTLAEKQPAGTPPSTFLFLPFHLSNSPEPGGPSPRRTGEPSKLHAFDKHRKLGSPNISEVLRRRDIAPRGGRAPYEGYIVLRRVGCQHLIIPKPAATKSPPRSSLMAARRSSPRREPVYSLHGGRPKGADAGKAEKDGKDGKHARGPGHAALRPHSSAVLWGSGGRCQFGGICARVMGSRDPSGVTRNRLKQLARDGRKMRSAPGNCQRRTALVR